MRSFVFLAACALTISVGLAACVTLDEVEDKPEPEANKKIVNEIVGMITGKKPAPAAAGEKKGPVGGDWKTKLDEAKRKEEEAKKRALEKQQKYVTETKRNREQMLKDKARILSLIEDDKIERQYRFYYPEPETTTLSPEQEEALRVEKEREKERVAELRRKYGESGVKRDAIEKREAKERADREMKRKIEEEKKRALKEKDAAEHKRFQERIADYRELRRHIIYRNYSGPMTTQTPVETPKPPCECRLTLKFPDGTTQVRDYSPKEQLAAVRLYVRLQNPTVPLSKISLSKDDKQFTGTMMKESFGSLGLCPASELNIKLN